MEDLDRYLEIGDNMGRPKGSKNKRPYWRASMDIPKTDKKGYVWVGLRKRAWIVAEEKLGRKLLPREEVHHINGIKGDDHPDNLEVLTKSQHSSLTATAQHAEGNFGRVTWYEESILKHRRK